MRDALTIGLFTLFFLFGVALVSVIASKQKEPQPLDTNPKLLDCDTEFYADREVRVKTDGMETVEGELRYRRRTDLPYCVVLKFKDGIPSKTPPLVVGNCIGRQGPAVIVTGCR